MPSRSRRWQRDIHSTCRWDRVVPTSLRRQNSTNLSWRELHNTLNHGKWLSWLLAIAAPLSSLSAVSPSDSHLSLQHTLARTLPKEAQPVYYNLVTPSPLQLPQPRAGNAIRGSARPAGSALLLSGWGRQLTVILSVLDYPSAVSLATFTTCPFIRTMNIVRLCMCFILKLIFYSFFTAAVTFVGQSGGNCGYIHSFFPVQFENWYAQNCVPLSGG